MVLKVTLSRPICRMWSWLARNGIWILPKPRLTQAPVRTANQNGPMTCWRVYDLAIESGSLESIGLHQQLKFLHLMEYSLHFSKTLRSYWALTPALPWILRAMLSVLLFSLQRSSPPWWMQILGRHWQNVAMWDAQGSWRNAPKMQQNGQIPVVTKGLLGLPMVKRLKNHPRKSQNMPVLEGRERFQILILQVAQTRTSNGAVKMRRAAYWPLQRKWRFFVGMRNCRKRRSIQRRPLVIFFKPCRKTMYICMCIYIYIFIYSMYMALTKQTFLAKFQLGLICCWGIPSLQSTVAPHMQIIFCKDMGTRCGKVSVYRKTQGRLGKRSDQFRSCCWFIPNFTWWVHHPQIGKPFSLKVLYSMYGKIHRHSWNGKW